jgi:hypothetical protein
MANSLFFAFWQTKCKRHASSQPRQASAGELSRKAINHPDKPTTKAMNFLLVSFITRWLACRKVPVAAYWKRRFEMGEEDMRLTFDRVLFWVVATSEPDSGPEGLSHSGTEP